jgi:hypothetical protein
MSEVEGIQDTFAYQMAAQQWQRLLVCVIY